MEGRVQQVAIQPFRLNKFYSTSRFHDRNMSSLKDYDRYSEFATLEAALFLYQGPPP